MRSPVDFGFRRTSAGRWRGTVNYEDVVLEVDHINRRPDYAGEEDLWEAEAIRYDSFGDRHTFTIGTFSSERAAVDAAAGWAESVKNDAANFKGFF